MSKKAIQTSPNYKVIERINIADLDPEETDFEEVEFKNCICSDLSNKRFSNCLFSFCDLSNALVRHTSFQDVKFADCKMIGVNFQDVNPFGLCVEFENSVLNYTNFDKQKMNKSSFSNCKLHWASFVGTDLSKTKIEDCDFSLAVFWGTNLMGVDFTTNYNFDINPTENRIKKAKFKTSNLRGLLESFDIIIEEF